MQNLGAAVEAISAAYAAVRSEVQSEALPAKVTPGGRFWALHIEGWGFEVLDGHRLRGRGPASQGEALGVRVGHMELSSGVNPTAMDLESTTS